LCGRGANVHAARTTDGYTSLMCAILRNNLEVVKELCLRDIDVIYVDNDNLRLQPISLAEYHGHNKIYEYLTSLFH